MQVDTGSLIKITSLGWRYLRRKWLLTAKEREIITKARLHPNSLYILSVDVLPEIVRIGVEVLGSENNPKEIAEYVEAFRSLETMGFIQHVSNRAYKLTARGYENK